MSRFQDWEGDAEVDSPKFGRSDSFEAPDPFAAIETVYVAPAQPPPLRAVPDPPAERPQSVSGDMGALEAAYRYSQDEEWAAKFDNEMRNLIQQFTDEYRRRRDAEFRQLERMQRRLQERTGVPALTAMDDSFLFIEAQRGERMSGKEKAEHIAALIKAAGEEGIKAMVLGRRVGESPYRYLKMLPEGTIRKEGELMHMKYIWVGKKK